MPPKSRASERIAAARALYDDPAVTLVKIAKVLQISPETFAQLRKVWDWPPRAPARRVAKTVRLLDTPLPPPDSAAVADPGERQELLAALHEPAGPLDHAALLAQLDAALTAEIALATQQMKRGRPGTPQTERSARIMASLVRTLAQAKQLQRSGDAGLDEDAGPEALGDLHDELARRLDGLRDSGAAR